MYNILIKSDNLLGYPVVCLSVIGFLFFLFKERGKKTTTFLTISLLIALVGASFVSKLIVSSRYISGLVYAATILSGYGLYQINRKIHALKKGDLFYIFVWTVILCNTFVYYVIKLVRPNRYNNYIEISTEYLNRTNLHNSESWKANGANESGQSFSYYYPTSKDENRIKYYFEKTHCDTIQYPENNIHVKHAATADVILNKLLNICGTHYIYLENEPAPKIHPSQNSEKTGQKILSLTTSHRKNKKQSVFKINNYEGSATIINPTAPGNAAENNLCKNGDFHSILPVESNEYRKIKEYYDCNGVKMPFSFPSYWNLIRADLQNNQFPPVVYLHGIGNNKALRINTQYSAYRASVNSSPITIGSHRVSINVKGIGFQESNVMISVCSYNKLNQKTLNIVQYSTQIRSNTSYSIDFNITKDLFEEGCLNYYININVSGYVDINNVYVGEMASFLPNNLLSPKDSKMFAYSFKQK